MVTGTKIKKCPHCGRSDRLDEDEDGVYCLCGWHDYGEIPSFVKTVDRTSGYSWGLYKDRGCISATKKLGRQSTCKECPYPKCIFSRRKPKY
jgi:hypothetical protein